MVSGVSIFFVFAHKLMQCLRPVEVPVGIDKAAYDVLVPCTPRLKLKGGCSPPSKLHYLGSSSQGFPSSTR